MLGIDFNCASWCNSSKIKMPLWISIFLSKLYSNELKLIGNDKIGCRLERKGKKKEPVAVEMI
jgi:hypothetical protein